MLSVVRVHGVSAHQGDINMAKRSVHRQTVPTCGVSTHQGDYCIHVIMHTPQEPSFNLKINVENVDTSGIFYKLGTSQLHASGIADLIALLR